MEICKQFFAKARKSKYEKMVYEVFRKSQFRALLDMAQDTTVEKATTVDVTNVVVQKGNMHSVNKNTNETMLQSFMELFNEVFH